MKLVNFRVLMVVSVSILITGVFYWFYDDAYAIRVPLRTQTGSDYFYVESKVNGSFCFLKLSLGSNLEFLLSQRLIESVPNKKIGVSKLTHEEGIETENFLYRIPEITIGTWKVKNAIVTEEIYDFSPDIPSSKSNRSYRIGELGSKILERTNILLDIPHSCLYFAKSISELKKLGYRFDDWVKVPFEKIKNSMKIEVETDLGVKSFLILSSAPHIALRSSQLPIENEIFQSQKFKINETDFGLQDLFSFDLPDVIPVDGVIGLNFLKDHAIYIDYSNKRLYIQR